MVMGQDKQQVGRLALRVEGDWWVAYYATPETMEGAFEIARIRMGVVMDQKRKAAFMDLAFDAVREFLESATGVEVTGREERAAPEHERAGRA